MAAFYRAYQPSRTAFLQAVTTLQAATTLKVTLGGYDFALRGPEKETLRTDFCLLSHTSQANRLLLVTTGVHGCELYAGSAVVRAFLAQLAAQPSLLPLGTALAVVHAVNPFGAAWARRENINNVDLNRNFLPNIQSKADFSLLDHKRKAFYAQYGYILDCSRAVSFRFLRNIMLKLRLGEEELVRILLPGQRQFPTMLFYGGNTLQEEVLQLTNLLNTRLLPPSHSFSQVLHLDLHTALGPWGQSTLIAADEDSVLPVKQGQDTEGLRHVLGKEGFPKVEGDLVTNLPGFLTHIAGVKWRALVEEYGTYGKTKIYLTQVPEHVHYHRHSAWLQAYSRSQTSDFDPNYLKSPEKNKIIEIFCPRSPAWEEKTLQAGCQTLRTALQFLT